MNGMGENGRKLEEEKVTGTDERKRRWKTESCTAKSCVC